MQRNQTAPYPPEATGSQPYQGSDQQGGLPPSSYQPDHPHVAGGEPNNVQLPPDVTVDKLRMGSGDNATFVPSAPPAEAIQGYGNVTFQDAMLPPPPNESRQAAPTNRPPISGVPVISEDDARLALIEHCKKNCCYGKGAATEMIIRKMESSSAHHYILETFGEARSTAWIHTPYNGGPVDGPQYGQPPTPWSIPLHANQKFQDDVKRVAVPHTAYVKTCEKCYGMGRLRCHHCSGMGHHHCTSCHHGYTGHGEERRVCSSCHGSGRRQCMWCHGRGHIQCTTCRGCGKLKWYIQLTVTWRNHAEDFILERTAMPDKYIRKVQGVTAMEEESPSVYPVTQCPEPTVNRASAELIAKHRVQFSSERILLQRHRIRIVPVTEANADWKDKNFTFYVHGIEREVFTDNYPQACCCGCSII